MFAQSCSLHLTTFCDVMLCECASVCHRVRNFAAYLASMSAVKEPSVCMAAPHVEAAITAGEDELVWDVSVPLPVGGKLSYKYAVVDEGGGIVAEEFEPRSLDVTDMSEGGSLIELADVWQVWHCCAATRQYRIRGTRARHKRSQHRF